MNFKRSKLYMHSPNWMKNKTTTIKPFNKRDNKC